MVRNLVFQTSLTLPIFDSKMLILQAHGHAVHGSAAPRRPPGLEPGLGGTVRPRRARRARRARRTMRRMRRNRWGPSHDLMDMENDLMALLTRSGIEIGGYCVDEDWVKSWFWIPSTKKVWHRRILLACFGCLSKFMVWYRWLFWWDQAKAKWEWFHINWKKLQEHGFGRRLFWDLGVSRRDVPQFMAILCHILMDDDYPVWMMEHHFDRTEPMLKNHHWAPRVNHHVPKKLT